MRSFLTDLLSGDESGIDSAVVGGFSSLLVFFGMTVFTVIHDPSTWNAMAFAGAAGIIVGIAAGGKTVRDRWSSTPTPPSPPSGSPQ